jgi:mannose-6-phosphate isomerase
MNPWYPLRFQPLLRRYLWGGRRLQTMLGKEIGEEDCAESWEIVDRGADQSVVINGRFTGWTLHQLITRHGPEMLGRHHPQDRFPLLLKLLDCQQDLSVQVHPNDQQAAGLDPPDLGKTEAWVVLHADPGSRIYAGLKSGVDRRGLAQSIAERRITECLHWFQPSVGDCVFIPAGTVHALGAGLVVAEIQQASDTTFRLYDWDRVGPDGQPRPLHIPQALDVIDFDSGPVNPQPVPMPEGSAEKGDWLHNRLSLSAHQTTIGCGAWPLFQPASEGSAIQRLVECDKFVLERRVFDTARRLGQGDCLHLLAVIGGRFSVADATLNPGDVILLPAAADGIRCQPMDRAIVLDIRLP